MGATADVHCDVPCVQFTQRPFGCSNWADTQAATHVPSTWPPRMQGQQAQQGQQAALPGTEGYQKNWRMVSGLNAIP